MSAMKCGEIWRVEFDPAIGGEIGKTRPAAILSNDTATLKLDCSKARARLGWHPRWHLPTALAGIVRWHKQMLLGDNMQTVSLRQIAHYQSQAHP